MILAERLENVGQKGQTKKKHNIEQIQNSTNWEVFTGYRGD